MIDDELDGRTDEIAADAADWLSKFHALAAFHMPADSSDGRQPGGANGSSTRTIFSRFASSKKKIGQCEEDQASPSGANMHPSVVHNDNFFAKQAAGGLADQPGGTQGAERSKETDDMPQWLVDAAIQISHSSVTSPSTSSCSNRSAGEQPWAPSTVTSKPATTSEPSKADAVAEVQASLQAEARVVAWASEALPAAQAKAKAEAHLADLDARAEARIRNVFPKSIDIHVAGRNEMNELAPEVAERSD